jgi:hypothetical protein
MRVAAAELKRLGGAGTGPKRLWRLVWIPYVTAGVFACCWGSLNQTMGFGSAVGLAAASSFGGGFGLLRVPDMQRGWVATEVLRTRYLSWSPVWGSVAVVTIVVFILFIGPGLR